jgi:undecaprenyl-diphosphatase
MKKSQKIKIIIGVCMLFAFIIWTSLVSLIDVKSIAPFGNDVGFSCINSWFHSITGVNMWLYYETDALSILILAVALGFGILGLVQLIKRKSIIKVDFDILMLGAHYIAVIFSYLFFEIFVINYRPILIEGALEASYPSSTTMLVLTIMIPFIIQMNFRIKSKLIKRIIISISTLFTAFMVMGRIISGVHWITDIIGGVLLSIGLIMIYCALYKICLEK